MIDMSKFLRDYGEDALIEKLALTNQGGSSIEMLQTFMPETVFILVPCSASPKMIAGIPDQFDKYGPALVGNCNLDQQFLDFKQEVNNTKDAYDLYEIPTFTEYLKVENSCASHAMVLIGYKHDPCYGYEFLLQNWWRGMQFCWVSENYLMKSGASVHFVMNKQSGFGNGKLTTLKNAEALFADRSDGCFSFDACL